MVTQRAPATDRGSRFGEELRQPRQGAGPCPAGRRRAIIVSGMVALALATGGCTASGHPGSHAVSPARASTVASPPHRGGQGRSVQLVVEASGDLLIHSAIFDRALVLGGGRYYNFAPMFAEIKPYIRGADLALCHVETPMTPAAPTGYPTFNTPPELATAIAQTGWRACSTAATHSLDQGQAGVDDTIRALDRAGVAHTGTFSSSAAQRTPLIMTVKGVRVAFLAYTELTNGIPSPHPWSVNRANAAQILADAHRARLDGAQVVIVNLHWGDQYVARPSSFQLALAGTLTHSPDITAVVGQHVHIVQPIRILNGKLVVFGEGNLISNQTSACCPAASQDGMIVLLTITVDSRGARVTFIHYVPIWVRHPDFVVLPAGTAWRTDPADAAALRASYERTVAVVGRGPDIQPIPAHLLSGRNTAAYQAGIRPPRDAAGCLRTAATSRRIGQASWSGRPGPLPSRVYGEDPHVRP
jgi:Bacterial capsule synthesis protein PGA_cap